MRRSANQPLFFLLVVYAVASFIHFVHNAEFLSAYPGLPDSWTRAGVYFAWLAMTSAGAAGSLLLYRGYERMGLLLLAAYALLGMDSLGHYVLAPLSAHTLSMNSTILLEVTAAGVVLIAVVRRMFEVFKKQVSGAR